MFGSWLDVTVAVMAAGILGAMLFFAAVVAPTVFRALSEEHASAVLRALFPRYYLALGLASLTATLTAALATNVISAIVLAACAGIFLLGRYVAVPIINSYRDKMLAGDRAAQRRFGIWHRVAVVTNVLQMVSLVYVLVIAT